MPAAKGALWGAFGLAPMCPGPDNKKAADGEVGGFVSWI
jgi:hypothetical protein